MYDAPERTDYARTPSNKTISGEADRDAISAIITETVQLATDENRRSRTRRLIMIQGEAGVGKTWFLDYVHAEMATQQPAYRLIKRHAAPVLPPLIISTIAFCVY